MKKLRKVILITLIYIGLILISTKSFATTGTTIKNTTRLREEPSTSCSTVYLISAEQKVEIVSEEGEWYKVSYNNDGKKFQGYIRKDMLSVEGEVSNNKQENENQENDEASQISENETTSQEGENTLQNEKNQIEEGYTGILSNNITIRILPSINSTQIGEITANTKVQVKEVINKWGKIETENESGWALIKKVESKNEDTSSVENTEKVDEQKPEERVEEPKVEEKKEEKKILYVSTETVNMREKAETSSKILKQLSLNDTVEVVQQVDGTWTKVSKDGKEGYIASKFLSESKTEVTSRSLTKSRSEEENLKDDTTTAPALPNVNNTVSQSKGEEVVAYAKQYLGCKYVSGGASPKSGFDCSGFTYYVFKNFGITLNRSSGAQVSNGTQVDKEDLQLGDLVLFQGWGTTSIGHVGIYIGGNSFIHAANGNKGVVITSLSDSYYSKKYVTARRVIN